MRAATIAKALALVALSATIIVGGMTAVDRQKTGIPAEDSADVDTPESDSSSTSEPPGDSQRPVVVRDPQSDALAAELAAVSIARNVKLVRVTDIEAAIDEELRKAIERRASAYERAPEFARRQKISIRTVDNSVALTGQDGTVYIWYVCAVQQPSSGGWQVLAQKDRCAP